LLVAK